MSEPTLPPDQAARDRIGKDLERNLLVEAGAGSGKTTSLVDRMVALVRSRACTVEQIAAVTFTRKAAAELRQKFQVVLEREAGKLAPGHPDLDALEAAIRDIDHAFLGTIHAFCAKLLRERPLEAGLDPGFREVLESEAERMQRGAWVEYLERLATDGDPRLEELDSLGIAPDLLQDTFRELVENPDVDFGFERVEPPDAERVRAVRADFEELLDRGGKLMKGRTPADGWDGFGKRIRTLLYWRRTLDWSDPRAFFDALARVHLKKSGLVQKRWADDGVGKARAKRLFEDFREFAAAGGAADRLLREWWAYRYPVAIGVARDAAASFAGQRKDRGQINFQDLLVLSAALLREDPEARHDLGRRYPRVLVDEFQDTDPLQAEILLLLASDPETGDDWRTVVPRPGALFVVGDPKQSIYRFRRADIALYQLVKKRFQEFGDVLPLEANFRSLGGIGALVKGVFDRGDRFGKRDTDRQAAFAPLLTQREGTGVLATYGVSGGRRDQVAGDDADRIATEIARRVAEGERQPDDFLILTRNRRYLSVYARALEDRNLPVDVSGAGVGFEDELAALLLLFRSLEDPAHRPRVLGVLTGPLFGITLDRLVAYRDGGGRFRINRPAEGKGEVADAINVLHGWWKRALREPADVTAERLIGETGLFPLAAAGNLGGLRAGALSYLLDAVRARALEGDTSIAGAVDALETALDWEDAEAPLVPGRRNCVRVMNLHRAKGLEANVVFLAAPFGEFDREPRMRVARDEMGTARGTMPIVVKRGLYATEVITQPATWEGDQKVEATFEEAEKTRLLYVAATRARDELWIARGKGLRGRNSSPWMALEEWVDGLGMGIHLPRGLPPEPDQLDPETDLTARIAAVASAAARTRSPSYRLETVTARAKGAPAQEPVVRDPAVHDPAVRTDRFDPSSLDPTSGGYDWGSVVHDVLAAAGEGTHGEALAHYARGLLVEHERPVDATGEPTELEALMALVEAVRDSDIWARAMASSERHSEVPFAVNRSGGRAPGGASDAPESASDAPEVLEGVIDLVFRDGNSWVVADYKTDSGDDPDFVDRVSRYRAQVDLYAECWEQLTGERVGERVLVYTAQGRTESW